MKNKLLKYFKNKRLMQVGLLFGVNILGIPLGVIASIIVTQYLGPKAYGDYKFVISVLNFAIILLVFGVFQAGNRAIVLSNNKQQTKELYGVLLVFLMAIFLLISIVLFFYLKIDPNIKEKQLELVVLSILPFSWVFLLKRYFEVLFQADNRIKLLSYSRVFPQLFYLIAAIFIYYGLIGDVSINKVEFILLLYIGTQLVAYCYILLKLQVSFSNIKARAKQIVGYVKSYGFDVYLGSIVALGFIQLTEILISYYGNDNSGVGFYSLAVTFSLPLTIIPNTIATTHYKDFSEQLTVPGKLILVTIGLSLISFAALVILVKPFVLYFYGEEFSPVIRLNLLISFGALFHGFADFFNRFLGSHGQGKMLRNSSILVGVATLLLNLPLISHYGEYGGAIARIGTGVIYFICIYWFYKKYCRTLMQRKL